jgi:hypothetical protein
MIRSIRVIVLFMMLAWGYDCTSTICKAPKLRTREGEGNIQIVEWRYHRARYQGRASRYATITTYPSEGVQWQIASVPKRRPWLCIRLLSQMQ